MSEYFPEHLTVAVWMWNLTHKVMSIIPTKRTVYNSLYRHMSPKQPKVSMLCVYISLSMQNKIKKKNQIS
jgi:hypothetical protein